MGPCIRPGWEGGRTEFGSVKGVSHPVHPPPSGVLTTEALGRLSFMGDPTGPAGS